MIEPGVVPGYPLGELFDSYASTVPATAESSPGMTDNAGWRSSASSAWSGPEPCADPLPRCISGRRWWSNSDLFDDRFINYLPFVSLGWDYRQPWTLWEEKFELFGKGSYERFVDQPSPI